MTQKNSDDGQTTVLILGTVRSERQNLFSKLNAFSLLLVKDKDGRTIINIPAWPALVVFAVFIAARINRSRQ